MLIPGPQQHHGGGEQGSRLSQSLGRTGMESVRSARPTETVEERSSERRTRKEMGIAGSQGGLRVSSGSSIATGVMFMGQLLNKPRSTWERNWTAGKRLWSFN